MKITSPYCHTYDPEKEESKILPSWFNLNITDSNNLNFFFYNEKDLKYKTGSLDLIFLANRKILNLESDENLLTLLPELNFDAQSEFYNLTSFLFLRKSSFISFFVENMIDVPICFKKSKSLKRKNFELNLLKFVNLLMRQGKKEKTIKQFNTSFFNFFLAFKITTLWKNTTVFDWIDLFFFFNNSFKHFEDGVFDDVESQAISPLLFNNFIVANGKLVQNNFFIKNFIQSKISPITPVFSYFIYNVDKNVRKFSRGKSGKYLFIWKYIAPYKRLYVTFKWIFKDVTFNAKPTFLKRVEDTFLNLTLNPQDSFAWKSKNYTYAYIFKNMRKSLMANLKTIAK